MHNENRGLSDIIAALEGQGHKANDAKSTTKTVTVQAAAKGNGTCAAPKTVTVTQQNAAAAGTGYFLLHSIRDEALMKAVDFNYPS